MPTAEGCAGRRRRLWDALPSPCDALVINDPRHLTYLAGYAPSPFTFRTASGGAVLVLFPDRSVLVGDNLLRPFLDEAHVDEIAAPTWYDGRTSPEARDDVLWSAVIDLLARGGVVHLGVERTRLPLTIAAGLGAITPVEIAPTLRAMRRTKDPDEVAAIRRALRAADAGMAAALREVRPGMSEMEAFRIIERAATEAMGERAFIYGDFVSGPELTRRLGPPSARTMEAGDPFLMDFSVVVNGYRGDTANTMVIGGRPTAEARRRHDACLAALAAGERALKPGTACRAIDEAMRRAFREAGGDPDVAGHFGHGIGLDHPEAPFIVAESDEVLRVGDVVTLEPGQYGLPWGGMRVERNYRVDENGPEALSGHEVRMF